ARIHPARGPVSAAATRAGAVAVRHGRQRQAVLPRALPHRVQAVQAAVAAEGRFATNRMKTALLERTIETVVLAAAAWPVIQSGVSMSFWRAFPHFARRLAALVSAYLVLVVVTMLWGPSWLTRTMAIAGGLGLLASFWHGRIARGR